MVSETKCYLSTKIERLTYLSTLTSGTKNHNFNIPLILDKCSIVIVMQKVKINTGIYFCNQYSSIEVGMQNY